MAGRKRKRAKSHGNSDPSFNLSREQPESEADSVDEDRGQRYVASKEEKTPEQVRKYMREAQQKLRRKVKQGKASEKVITSLQKQTKAAAESRSARRAKQKEKEQQYLKMLEKQNAKFRVKMVRLLVDQSNCYSAFLLVDQSNCYSALTWKYKHQTQISSLFDDQLSFLN